MSLDIEILLNNDTWQLSNIWVMCVLYTETCIPNLMALSRRLSEFSAFIQTNRWGFLWKIWINTLERVCFCSLWLLSTLQCPNKSNRLGIWCSTRIYIICMHKLYALRLSPTFAQTWYTLIACAGYIEISRNNIRWPSYGYGLFMVFGFGFGFAL